jgi:hypothetical protein
MNGREEGKLRRHEVVSSIVGMLSKAIELVPCHLGKYIRPAAEN